MSSQPSPTSAPNQATGANKARRRRSWALVITLLVIAAVGTLYSAFGNFDVTLTRDTLQQKIDAKLPFTTKSNVVISGVQLDLSGDKINLAVAAQTRRMNAQLSGTGTTTGTLRYDGAGNFYFHPDELKVTGLKVGDETHAATRTERVIDKFMQSRTAERVEPAAEKLLQKGAEMALERIPVYRVKDDFKGTIIKAGLSSVEVKNNAVVAHVSLWRITGVVFAYLAVGLIGLALGVALMLAPEGFILLGMLPF